MLAHLELINRNGYAVRVNFIINENMLIDPQINIISENFTGVKSATLTMKGNDDQTFVREYEQNELIETRLTRRWV